MGSVTSAGAIGDCCLKIIFLGRRSYEDVSKIQAQAVMSRSADQSSDTVYLVEHDPVVTLGRANDAQLTCSQRSRLLNRGIQIVSSSRGGKATYHGPGQLVIYPILSLRERNNDAHGYLRSLELLVSQWLQSCGVTAIPRPGLTGVWASGGKIASIGVRVFSGVTSHGVAVNLNTDLTVFELFEPCGLDGFQITSVNHETGFAPSLSEATDSIAPYLNLHLNIEQSMKTQERVVVRG